MEHPFGGSWGYQTTVVLRADARFGGPTDFMAMIDHLHQRGIGVILDWVPAHFPPTTSALACFDGTHLFEHADPRQGFHPDWDTLIFDYEPPRGAGVPHQQRGVLARALPRRRAAGGRRRVDALPRLFARARASGCRTSSAAARTWARSQLLQRARTQEVYARRFPDVQMIAEESTAWPGVSRPIDDGGLGFGLKWDMGWMHDTLEYFEHEPIHRRFHHDELTFRAVYACTENFVLPLSHDEVVHGKGSLLAKMPGDDWQRFANLRLLFGYMYAQPGKKLLFMGGELGQWREWDHDGELDWQPARRAPHAGHRALDRAT